MSELRNNLEHVLRRQSQTPSSTPPPSTPQRVLRQKFKPALRTPYPDDEESNNGQVTFVKRRPEIESDFLLLPSKKFKSSPIPDAKDTGHVPEVAAEAGACPASSNTIHSDLALKSTTTLRALLLSNSEMTTNIMDRIVNYYCGQNDGADIVSLNSIKQVLDRRFAAITTILHSHEQRSQSFPTSAPRSAKPVEAPPRSPTPTQQGERSMDTVCHSPHFEGTQVSITEPERVSQDEPDQHAAHEPLHACTESNAHLLPLLPPFNASRVDHTASPYYSEIIRILKSVFSLHDFRKNQLEAITGTMEGRDVFVLMPTGGGKSLCYQVPALCKSGKTRGVSFVVSPLLSLMHDQADGLKRKGVDVLLWNSEKTGEDLQEIRQRLTAKRKPSMVYITPEKLKENQTLRSLLTRLYEERDLARFIIDEAHCISTWGRDFRDAYQSLDSLRKDFPDVPIMALTATAKKTVVDDIIERLGIPGCLLLSQSFNRQNLHYVVRPKTRNVLDSIASYINGRHPTSSGVIYCFSRSNCEDVARTLREKHKISARHYHAGMSTKDKATVQKTWQEGECHVIVATIAFGMGIDKANVRFVIHHFLPKSMEGYYQETGRAGRDGLPADCVLYYSHADSAILMSMIRHDKDRERPASEEEIKRQESEVRAVIQYCQNVVDCRRVQLLAYFSEDFDSRDCHRSCDNCLDISEVFTQDVSHEAADAIRLLKSLTLQDKAKITQNYCLDVFRGANLKEIRERGHHEHPLYGAGQHLARDVLERMFGQLLGLDAFRLVSVQNTSGWHNNYLELGSMAETYLKGKPVIIGFKGASDKMPPQKRIGKTKSRMVAIPEFSTRFATQHDLQQEEDSYCKLYKHLQALRQRIAQMEGVEDEEILRDVTIQMLSITCPQEADTMKAVIETDIQEFIDLDLVKMYVEDRWKKYGQQFLDLCIQEGNNNH